MLQVASTLIWVILSSLRLHKSHISEGEHSLALLGAIFWSILGLIWLLQYFFIYWEIREHELFERRLLKVSSTPFEKITAVEPWPNSERFSSTIIAVRFGRVGSALEPETNIIVSAADREGFVQALRRHVPQLEFAV